MTNSNNYWQQGYSRVTVDPGPPLKRAERRQANAYDIITRLLRAGRK